MTKAVGSGALCLALASILILPACRQNKDPHTPDGVLGYVYDAIMSGDQERVVRYLAKDSDLHEKYASDPTALTDLQFQLAALENRCAGKKIRTGKPGEPVHREVDNRGGDYLKWTYLFSTYEVPIQLIDRETKTRESVGHATVMCIQDLGRSDSSYDYRRRLAEQGIEEGTLGERSFPLWGGDLQGPCVIREFAFDDSATRCDD